MVVRVELKAYVSDVIYKSDSFFIEMQQKLDHLFYFHMKILLAYGHKGYN